VCGLVGCLAFPSGTPLARSRLDAMRDAMAHRGPEGSGTWASADGRMILGHRRLAIIDPTPAAGQPMVSSDGRYTVVFNGEIYNHADLRKELSALGVRRWQTDHSDTEVLLESFARWGVDCVHRFRGMFAFALWDDVERELWLVRDRIGVKPMYFTQAAGRLLFASEIKALLADDQVPRRVDEESLFHYLSYLVAPAPRTLFAGIEKLEAGTWLRARLDGTIHRQRYWDPWDAVEPLDGYSEKDIAERVLEELRTAVALRKVSDVPVGLFLSGGIDSSTNTALFSEGETSPVRTFSVGYEGEFGSYQNELHFAAKMAATVGSEHHERMLTQDDILGFLPAMVRLQDEPIGDPVAIPLYYLAEMAKANGVTVCQVGEGADELFWGYQGWKGMTTLQRRVDRTGPRHLMWPLVRGLELAGKRQSLKTEYLRRAARGQPVFRSGAEIFPDEQKWPLLSERLRRDLRGLSSWAPLEATWARYNERAWEKSPLHWMTYADLNLRIPELLLMRVDKMTMAASVEAREPFLDHAFVELALGIPTAVKMAGGELKHILKTAVRGLIPDELIDRPKQGFGVPVHDYFMDRLGGVVRTELDVFCRETDLFDAAGVDALLARGTGADAWYLLNVALWWKEYIR
jgi:asparagine synthase (glutamine-hydrolysing)